MRYLPLLGLLLLIGVALGAPYGFGLVAESRFSHVVGTLSTRDEDSWRLRLVDYDRGYLSARAKTELIPPKNSDGKAVPTSPILLETRLAHGVTGVRAITRLAEERSAALAVLFPGQKPRLRLEAGISGNLDGRLVIPAFDWSPETEVPVLSGTEGSVEELTMTLDWQRGGEHNLGLDWPGLVMQLGAAELRVEEVNLDHRLTPLRENLWEGRSHLRVERVIFDPVLADPVVTREASVRFESSEEDGYLNGDLSVAVESLETEMEDFGRQVFKWRARSLHVSSLDSVLDDMMALQRLRVSRDGDLSERGNSEMKRYRSLSRGLQRLSSHGGQMAVPEVLVRLPEGRIEGQMMLSYPRRPAPERDEPVSLLRHASGEGVVIMDPDMRWLLPETAKVLLKRLERRDIIDGSNGVYHLDLRLEDMTLRLNDKVLEVPPLL